MTEIERLRKLREQVDEMRARATLATDSGSYGAAVLDASALIDDAIAEAEREQATRERDERVRELVKQVESNRRHERHRNHSETHYWLMQWRQLAEKFAALTPKGS